jgi:hypothetical protein
VQHGVTGQYRWLNRFMDGNIGFNQQRQVGGGSGLALRWDHRQSFDLSTTLNLNLNYVSDTRIVRDNAIDPLQNTQQITSSLNFSKRYRWGTLTLGGNRRQSLSDGSVQQLLPALTIAPVPIGLGSDITWSPGLSITNNTSSKTPLPDLIQVLPGGVLDTITQTGSNRVTALSFETPIRFGGFNWQNSIQATDERNTGRDSVQFRIPDTTTPDPNDSLSVIQVFPGSFRSTLDWDTGINLPVLLRGSWKFQPVLGIANSAAGQPFMLRSRATNGAWVQQSKRFRFGVSSAPTLFAFFPGIGPVARIRHSFSPVITWNYEPAANVPEEFARAIARPGEPLELRSDARQQLTVSLSQNLEGKTRPPAGDTASANARKLRLLSISTSAVTYDFEQAKKPGRTGGSPTRSPTRSERSPAVQPEPDPDLWVGQVGTDTAVRPVPLQRERDPAISSNTLRAVGSIFGLGEGVREAGTGRGHRPDLCGPVGPTQPPRLLL